MSMRAFPSVLLAALSFITVLPAGLAAENKATIAQGKTPDTAAIQAAAASSSPGVTPSQGVTKTRTKSNNSNDAAAPVPGEPANKPGDGNPVKIKTKSNIKND